MTKQTKWQNKRQGLFSSLFSARQKKRSRFSFRTLLMLISLAGSVVWLFRRPKNGTAVVETTGKREKRRAAVGQVDDLTEIEGIGPKTAEALRKAGISTYARLAASNEEEIRSALLDAGMSRTDASTWPEQARYAVQGDWQGLHSLRERLRSGRRVG